MQPPLGKILCELDGDHPDLSLEEVRSLIPACSPGTKLTHAWPNTTEPKFCLVSTRDHTPLLRAAFIKRLQTVEEAAWCANWLNLDTGWTRGHEGSFVVRVTKHCLVCPRAEGCEVSETGSPDMARYLGGVVQRTSKREVDLADADQAVRVTMGEAAYMGTVLHERVEGEFESRHVKHRPHFSPISLPPKLARCMVNLARVPPGGTLLDPFCGTGGVLIEAAEMGIGILGADADPDMVNGTIENLAAYGHSGDIQTRRIEDGLPQGVTCDAVVSDLPYGRSSKVFGGDVDDVAELAFRSVHEMLPVGGRFVCMLPVEGVVPEGFLVENRFSIFVHRSLTRYISVLLKV